MIDTKRLAEIRAMSRDAWSDELLDEIGILNTELNTSYLASKAIIILHGKRLKEIGEEHANLLFRIKKLRECLDRYKYKIPVNRIISPESADFEQLYGLGRDARETLEQDDEANKKGDIKNETD